MIIQHKHEEVQMEAIESYTANIVHAKDSTARHNLGVLVVWLLSTESDTDDSVRKGFAVALEEHAELTHKREGLYNVLDKLVYNPQFELDELADVVFFDDEDSARAYMQENYPQTDLVAEIEALFE